MANSKITDLTAGNPVAATDAFVIARSGANYKVTAADIWNTIRAGDGTVGAPAYSFSSDTDVGMFLAGTDLQLVVSGVSRLLIDPSNNVRVGSAYQFGWSSAGAANGAGSDTGLARNAAGVVKVTNGTSGAGQLTLEGGAGESRIAQGKVTLTEAGGAEVVAVVTLTASQMTGGTFSYTVRATDATDLAVRSGSFIFNAIDAAGTVTGAISTATSEANDGSTLTSTNSKTLTYAIATDVGTAHKFKITFNIDSDMVVSAASITWTMILNGPGTVSTS